MTSIRRRVSGRGAGLAARLFLVQLLVVAAGTITLWLVVAVAAPPIFRAHLAEAGTETPETLAHADEAFHYATGLSLTVAAVAALGAATGLSLYATRRITRPVQALASAARDVAAGSYTTPVHRPGIGAEFDQLTDAFRDMAGRLESVEATRRRLLADLAHEMRTPLATIDAYLEGLEDGVVPADVGAATVLRQQTARLTRLARDVAAVSSAEEHALDLHLTDLPAGELVRAAVAGARPTYAAQGVHLDVVQPDRLGATAIVRVDPDRIAQVLGNLLDNALRHTSRRGQVILSTNVDHDEVVVSVRDDGAGIAAEHLPHVFERFYRVDNARDVAHGGSGIGLSIARALAVAHGGRLTAASEGSGKGSTFTLTLPRVQ